MAKCGCLQGSLEASYLLYKPWGGSFEASCDNMDACALEMPFTEDEVFDALLGCNGDKASGLDGFSMVFW